MKHPCDLHCPDRSAECHAHCEKWLEYEKARNEEYKERNRAKELACIAYQIERDRKHDVATGKTSRRKSRKRKE